MGIVFITQEGVDISFRQTLGLVTVKWLKERDRYIKKIRKKRKQPYIYV